MPSGDLFRKFMHCHRSDEIRQKQHKEIGEMCTQFEPFPQHTQSHCTHNQGMRKMNAGVSPGSFLLSLGSGLWNGASCIRSSYIFYLN